MVAFGMSGDAAILPEDPTLLKAMIAALQADNARMSATIRAHDQLIQVLRLRCGSACKKDPVSGVIGVQEGPLNSMV